MTSVDTKCSSRRKKYQSSYGWWKEISKLLANRQHRLDRLEGHCLVPAFGVQARPIGYVPALLIRFRIPTRSRIASVPILLLRTPPSAFV